MVAVSSWGIPMKLVVAGLLAVLCVAPAMAQEASAPAAPVTPQTPKFFLSGGYGVYNDPDENVTLPVFTARATGFFTENFGIEGEVSTSAGSKTVAVGGNPPNVDFEIKHQYAGYFVARLPWGENGDVSARIGYGQAGMQVSGVIRTPTQQIPFKSTVDLDGAFYGLSAQYFFTKHVGVRGDIARFESNDDDAEGGLDTYTLALALRF